MNTLIILSHPDLEHSIANKTIIEAIKPRIKNLEIRHLEQLYPDFKIDIEAEQAALIKADTIIFQHPFYWYSTPALLKHWMDVVLSWGFAYGTGGDKLKGKHFLQSITIGGPKESYTAHGYNHFGIEDLLKPMRQTAYLTQMHYHPSIHTFRNFYAKDIWNSAKEVKDNAEQHAQQLIIFIQNLVQGPDKAIRDFVYKWFRHFDVLDENGFFIQYLDKNVTMKFPDTPAFSGHDGFHNWYNTTKAQFVGTTHHEVSDVVITKDTDNHYDVQLKVQLLAQTKEGQALDLIVDESWRLIWNTDSQRPLITNYDVSIAHETLLSKNES